MIPTSLDDWTVEVVLRLLSQGVFESDRFDLKEMLPRSRDASGKLRLRKTCAAFANSAGGFLVFGIKDDRGLTVDERLVGVDSNHNLPEHFGSMMTAITPAVDWAFLNPALLLESGRLLHVVEIKESRRKPHSVPDDDRYWFTKRTSKGTESMSYEEIRLAFFDSGRRKYDLRWLKAEVTRIRDLAQRVNIHAHADERNDDLILTRFDAGQIKTAIVPLFADLGGNEVLVKSLHELTEYCARVDAALAPMTAFAMLPRDRSYSGSRNSPETVLRRIAPQIVMTAESVLKHLARELS